MNSHPLFAESNARHRATALARMRKLLMIIGSGTIFSVLAWTTVTFLDDPHRQITDPENANETITVEKPMLMVDAWYPWDAKYGMTYFMSFIYQVSRYTRALLQSLSEPSLAY